MRDSSCPTRAQGHRQLPRVSTEHRSSIIIRRHQNGHDVPVGFGDVSIVYTSFMLLMS